MRGTFSSNSKMRSICREVLSLSRKRERRSYRLSSERMYRRWRNVIFFPSSRTMSTCIVVAWMLLRLFIWWPAFLIPSVLLLVVWKFSRRPCEISDCDIGNCIYFKIDKVVFIDQVVVFGSRIYYYLFIITTIFLFWFSSKSITSMISTGNLMVPRLWIELARDKDVILRTTREKMG